MQLLGGETVLEANRDITERRHEPRFARPGTTGADEAIGRRRRGTADWMKFRAEEHDATIVRSSGVHWPRCRFFVRGAWLRPRASMTGHVAPDGRAVGAGCLGEVGDLAAGHDGDAVGKLEYLVEIL
jgi:hypothetical protein